MVGLLTRYTKWLHAQWPAGTVEKLPEVRSDGSTNVRGLYVVGDLTGIPLLKFAADSGARAVHTIVADPSFQKERAQGGGEIVDLVIVGGSVSGMAAALEAKKAGLSFLLFEAAEPFSTIVNFPKKKPIFTYPTGMDPCGELKVTADVKEALVDELRAQTIERGIEPRYARVEKLVRKGRVFEVSLPKEDPLLARRAIVAIGRSGNFRKLGVSGEQKDKVYNRLHDPTDFADKDVLVVGGGDSAIETAIAVAQCGGRVTISYRKPEFARPKPENVARLEALRADPQADVAVENPSSERVTTAVGDYLHDRKKEGSIRLLLGSQVLAIDDEAVRMKTAAGVEEELHNDAVFAMIGREPPLDFFRRAGVKLRGETVGFEWVWVIGFFLAMLFVYDWKNDGWISKRLPFLSRADVFPNDAPGVVGSLGDWWRAQVADRSTVIGTLAVSMKSRSFYYTLGYTLAVGIFGLARMRRRKTPYVRVQTSCLILMQLFPLFLLPEVFLPWAGYNGWFDGGMGASVADSLFERYSSISLEDYLAGNWPDWGHPRAYWRAYGLILAWPLMVYNVFTQEPIVGWLVISVVQTFVLIPLLVWRFGKGAYCGWICSCGGLAETAGDTLRHKMFHGPRWNRLNMVGQVLLALAFVLLGLRVWGWVSPDGFAARHFALVFEGKSASGKLVNPLSWKWSVDVLMAGILGVGLYVKYSGRVWCRFACPLAALMHIYARFSQFRILTEKKKCISCNVCTSVCHQGIDIMNFANKGLPMEDPECVRCSACVQSCPTGVLEFGRVDRKTGEVIGRDRLGASPVKMREA